MKTTTDLLKELELLLRSRYSIIVLETDEEERAESLLKHLADRLDLPLLSWTSTKGLRRDGSEGSVYGSTDPAKALEHIESARFPAVYQFKGLGRHLRDGGLERLLKDAAGQFSELDGAIVLTGSDLRLPASLGPMSASVSLPAPDLQEYQDLLQHILRDLRSRGQVVDDPSPEDIKKLLQNLKGLTLLEAEKVLTKAIVEDGRLGPDDIREVVEAKREIVEREGLLEYYPVEESLEEIAGLTNLKKWLAEREAVITEPERAEEFGLPFPRGILLLGVPGCGKSLCAKATATEWGLPLLKLDPSNLYNKYLGESERNFKRAVETAERLAPVILWIDEIEKAFASSRDQDGGVSTRILGSFLSWLQERRGDVFVVATANAVGRLPPEFLRKGRFDETFFVDLPNAPTRRRIFAIHLRKRGKEPASFELGVLAEATEGFSGAEIEQVVVAGLHSAFAAGEELTTETLLREAEETVPLSETRREEIRELRRWAEGRTVPAN